ncbi:MAG TPA: patatin-like phospholipase family protein, partial [Roseiflexaceae bacterium]|nr:patatin-like phospholipase family protein [Roseiflexaceae bacterium]
MTAEAQRAETLRCDLVMKGGVTSGVVYPPVIAELAEKYRFEQIGGTSAGAIAAAVTAAAEYGRQRGHIDSFAILNELSSDISQPGRLLTLFRSTAPAHLLPVLDTLLPLVSNPEAAEGKPPVDAPAPGRLAGFVQRIAPELLALLPLSKQPAANTGDTISTTVRGLIARLPDTNPDAYARGHDAGALAGVRLGQYLIGAALVLTLLFALPLWIAQAPVAGWIAWALLGVLLVGGGFFAGRLLSDGAGKAGGTLAATADLARLALHDVPGNMYGVCTGHSETSSAEQPALTDWLDAWLQRVGGPTESGDPLTFADLQQHDVRLQMVTTNLSHGRPYILPFASDLILLFRRGDMARLFPNDVVAYLCKDEHLYPGWSLDDLNEGLEPDSPERFFMLPLSDSLPVLVGMRMSLSFPVLISAVRLYTVSAGCPQIGGEYRPRRQDIQENWFSDGGICSNFPIHFFDAWLPTHPTFGINLTALPKQAFAGNADLAPPEPGTVRVKGAESAQESGSVLPEYVSRITPDAPVAPISPPITKPSDEDYLRDSLLGVQSKSGEPALTSMPAPSSARVLLPDAEQPVDPLWRPMEGLSRFLWSMFDTAMNYRDTTQLMLPSYKER